MERLADETEDLVHAAIGRIRDVQMMLVMGASQGAELSGVPGLAMTRQGFVSQGADGPLMMLLRSVCSGIDSRINEIYTVQSHSNHIAIT